MSTSPLTATTTPRSPAYGRLEILLKEVDLIIGALPKQVRGTLKEQERLAINEKRDAFCKAALVMLSAALEAYCERLCEECNAHLKTGLGERLDKSDYEDIERAIRDSHGANTKHITSLFSLVGIPWITYEIIGWQGKSAADIRKELREMAGMRNKIAHGANATVSEGKVKQWRDFVLRFAEKLESITGDHLAKKVNTDPPWQ
jgi:hypothetical protein